MHNKKTVAGLVPEYHLPNEKGLDAALAATSAARQALALGLSSMPLLGNSRPKTIPDDRTSTTADRAHTARLAARQRAKKARATTRRNKK